MLCDLTQLCLLLFIYVDKNFMNFINLVVQFSFSLVGVQGFSLYLCYVILIQLCSIQVIQLQFSE